MITKQRFKFLKMIDGKEVDKKWIRWFKEKGKENVLF